MSKGTGGIEVTDCAIFPIKKKKPDSKLLAMAKVTLNEVFVVSGIRVVNGNKGKFIGFAQNYDKANDKGYDICYPITSELRDLITSAVIRKYNDDNAGEESQAEPENVDEFMDGI